MISRVSTAGLHAQGVASMLLQQARLAKVQNQLASGERMQSAADDPAGAASALALDQALSELDRQGSNANYLTHRLNLEESTLNGVTDVLARVRELAVAAGNGASTDAERATLAIELRERFDELVALANTQDGAGRYLFGGTDDATAAFTVAGTAVTYNGDQGRRTIAIAPGLELADGDPGSEIFQRITDTGGAQRDLFTMVQDLISAVQIPGSDAVSNAARSAALSAAQSNLTRAFDHVVDSRSALGARLSAADLAETQRAATSNDAKAALSEIRDLDYAEAVGRMNLLLVALQAAQQSYQQVQGSSLFDYLR